jgi:hypothetical protein
MEMGDYACMDCGARQPAGGPCRVCTSDPTLDLGDRHVRDMLLADDASRKSRRADRIRYVSVPIGIIVVIALAFVPGLSLLFAMGPFFSGYIASMVGVALLVMKLIDVTWPFKPRFPYLRS